MADWKLKDGFVYGESGIFKDQYLHIIIGRRMGLRGEIYHIDGDKLNNQRSNLAQRFPEEQCNKALEN